MASGIKSGVSGCVLLIPAIFMIVILDFIIFANPWYGAVYAIATLIFFMGILLVSLGTMKLGGHYKNMLPSAAGIIGLTATIMGLAGAIMELVWLFLPGFPSLSVISLDLYRAAVILGGIFFVVFGVAFIILRDKIGPIKLAIGTSVMAIISGALLCPGVLITTTDIIFLAGIMVLVPTSICAAYLFAKVKGIPEKEVKKVKKLVVRPAEVKEKPMKPEEIEDKVYKYVRKHPGGIDVAECADSLGISKRDVEKAINTLVKKGKLEIG